jgi:esterase/lipase
VTQARRPRRPDEPSRRSAERPRRPDEPSRRSAERPRRPDEPSRRSADRARRPDESSRRPDSSPPAPDSLRLFVALEFPAAARDALIAFRDGAADGATLAGHRFGTGPTAVVLSNMGDNDETDWQRFAPTLAGPGYSVLTYTYRYPPRVRSLTAEIARGAVEDLRGAVAFARAQGARRVILIGASLGGMLTAKVAGALAVDGAVIMAAPADRRDFDLRVEDAELAAIAAPKLFVVSEADPTVDPADTRMLFDRAPEPKRWQSFPGTAPGTRLYGTAAGPDLGRLLAGFVAGAPVGPGSASASR